VNIVSWLTAEPNGQTTLQLGELTLALVLSSLIGFEREVRMKSAGLRTHALVGTAAALIMIVSKYGFGDVISKYEIVLDPSRVAAQIVSGIGFIGGGLIFVQRDVVRGLTTAAVIWLTAAVGMACGSGLPLLAIFVTAAHFVVVYGFGPLERRMMSESAELRVDYIPGKGAIQEIVHVCTGRGFSIQDLTIRSDTPTAESPMQAIQFQVRGRRGGLTALIVAIGDVKGVTAVHTSQ
jgi:putative Mg2+ transporter-C (MgtC) family protein